MPACNDSAAMYLVYWFKGERRKMNMIEKVARAIAAESPEFECTEHLWPNAVYIVNAAIKSMREPTEEMIMAGDKTQLALGMQEIESKDTYQAMIDAALKD